MRVAIHLHTDYSFDSNVSVPYLLSAARRERLDCVAITDHDEIDGALEAVERESRQTRPIKVIVGQEVSSADGHIIGLFMREWIPPLRSGAETIDRIHDQGGIAIAAHPFATLCDNSLLGRFDALASRFDAVEVFNAQNPFPWQDQAARSAAERLGLPGIVGCDTHLRGRIAPAHQEMPAFSDGRSFLASLRSARAVTNRFGVWYLGRMAVRHLWDKCVPRYLPGFGVNLRPDRGAIPLDTLAARAAGRATLRRRAAALAGGSA